MRIRIVRGFSEDRPGIGDDRFTVGMELTVSEDRGRMLMRKGLAEKVQEEPISSQSQAPGKNRKTRR